MSKNAWFVHIQGETFGPVSTSVIQIMIRQNRLQFADFLWTEGMNKWVRIGELKEFSTLMPSYPSVPIPNEAALPNDTTEAVEVPTPAPVAQPSRQRSAEAPSKNWIRRYSRVPTDAKASVSGHGSFRAVDIGEGGVFFASDTPVAFGTDLRFVLTGGPFAKPVEMTGIVIREGESETGEIGFAVQFTRMNPAYRRIIQDYVKSRG